MVNLFPAWLAKSTDAFRSLAEQPVTLFLLLLALNAVVRPYSNCTHDARLYSLQVINQAEGGAYVDDVFLRYGSQDQYSIFSRIVAPLVALGGLRSTFFVLYLIFNTIFLWGLFRLVRMLIADPFVSTTALIYLVSAELYYGGHNIFTVHEQFFTPRLIATGLALHAMERLLSQRFAVSFVLLAIAMLFHPLMAFGGVLIWIGFLARLLMNDRVFSASLVVASVLGVLLLSFPPLALRVFGEIDDDWHDMIRLAVQYNYPDSWGISDWLNHLFMFALSAAGACWLYRADPIRSRFLGIATLIGVIGLAATFVASLSPYALLFQGQPYRAVWILKILQAPLGFMIFARCCQSAALLPRVTAIALAAFFLTVSFDPNQLMMLLFVLPLAIFYWRKLEDPVRPDWWYRAALSTLIAGAMGWMLYRWGFIIAQHETILTYYDQADLIRVFIKCVPALFWVGAVFLALRWLGSKGESRTLGWGCLLLALALPTVYFGLDVIGATRSRLTRHGADIAFAREVIVARGQRRIPAVYSSLGRADQVWLDLRATSYYDPLQTAGVMFRRDTALELRRRSELIRNFEMARLRKQTMFLSDDVKEALESMYQTKFDGPGPSEADLARLCQEPGLDFVVIPHEFPGLYAASNGRIFVYECAQVSRLRLSARSEMPRCCER